MEKTKNTLKLAVYFRLKDWFEKNETALTQQARSWQDIANWAARDLQCKLTVFNIRNTARTMGIKILVRRANESAAAKARAARRNSRVLLRAVCQQIVKLTNDLNVPCDPRIQLAARSNGDGQPQEAQGPSIFEPRVEQEM